MPNRFSVEDMRKVADMLRRKRQIENWKCEIDDKIDTLHRQQERADEELTDINRLLDGDYRELVEIALEIGGNFGDPESVAEKFKVHNPNYVTNHDKETLLQEILKNFKLENPSAEEMTFQQVKAVLKTRYGIETRTIGNFFRRQLGAYETRGGNKRKVVVIP